MGMRLAGWFVLGFFFLFLLFWFWVVWVLWQNKFWRVFLTGITSRFELEHISLAGKAGLFHSGQGLSSEDMGRQKLFISSSMGT